MIGIDIIKVERMERFYQRFGKRGLQRFLSAEEIVLAKNIKSMAGFWASKEAIAKAVGTGIGKELGFLDIELYKDSKGRPHFRLCEKLLKAYKIKDTSLSISHDGEYAVAVAVIETT